MAKPVSDAQELLIFLSTELGGDSENSACLRDRTYVNSRAMKTASVLYLNDIIL